MKKLSLLVLGILFVLQSFSQKEKTCSPQSFIVIAHKLNFRMEPKASGTIIDTLDNSELLTLIEIVEKKGKDYFDYRSAWLKVVRNKSGEIGFVNGNYLKPSEMAYLDYGDCYNIQKGFWYGISKEVDHLRVESITPKIQGDEEFKVIKSDKDHKYIICTQEEIPNGKINGRIIDEYEYFVVGSRERLLTIGKNTFFLICTGKSSNGSVKKEDEKIFFQTTINHEGRISHEIQDLTDCINQYGEVGYQIHFVGDLNGDGVPELLISEATTHYGTLYYFRSNDFGQLELVSKAYTYSKC